MLHIKDLPPNTEVFPTKVKLLPDETKSFKVVFFCKDEIDVDSEVSFLTQDSIAPQGVQTPPIAFLGLDQNPKIENFGGDVQFRETDHFGNSRQTAIYPYQRVIYFCHAYPRFESQ